MTWVQFNLLSSTVYLGNFSPVKHGMARILSPGKHGMARILSPVKHGMARILSPVKHGMTRILSPGKHSMAGIWSPPKHGSVRQGPDGRFCVWNLSHYGMHTQRFITMFVKHATPQMLNKWLWHLPGYQITNRQYSSPLCLAGLFVNLHYNG